MEGADLTMKLISSKKEVHFRHVDGQDYFISLPTPRLVGDDAPYSLLMDLLAAHGIQPCFEVEEDVKGRYLTVYVNKSLNALLHLNVALPDFAEMRQGAIEPYLYLSNMTVIAYDASFLAILEGVWNAQG
jgi:hypothetical protein